MIVSSLFHTGPAPSGRGALFERMIFMGDMREVGLALRARQREKKEQNYRSSKALLDARGVKYIEKPNRQLMVGDYNFWPSTGAYYNPKTGKKGRGVRNFLREIGVSECNPAE